MRIGIIGAGQVGTALGDGWRRAGHAVRYGVPDPTRAKYAGLAGGASTPAAAAQDAEVVVLATPWPATEQAIAGLGSLAGKIVIDCTNPLGMGAGGLQLAIGHSTSGGEKVAGWATGARVFKTLNQAGFEILGDPGGFAAPPAMFVAGDDAAAKPIVLGLVRDLGFEPVDAGPLVNARLLEPLAMLWIDQALQRGRGRDFAVALVRRARQ